MYGMMHDSMARLTGIPIVHIALKVRIGTGDTVLNRCSTLYTEKFWECFSGVIPYINSDVVQFHGGGVEFVATPSTVYIVSKT
jgi:hypothetical protein